MIETTESTDLMARANAATTKILDAMIFQARAIQAEIDAAANYGQLLTVNYTLELLAQGWEAADLQHTAQEMRDRVRARALARRAEVIALRDLEWEGTVGWKRHQREIKLLTGLC
jgi:hypothetical protein